MGFYDDRVLPHIINVVMNTEQTRRMRERVCADLKGEILEIGSGTGHNLPFLPADRLFMDASTACHARSASFFVANVPADFSFCCALRK